MDNHDITGYNPAEVTKTLAFASFFCVRRKRVLTIYGLRKICEFPPTKTAMYPYHTCKPLA